MPSSFNNNNRRRKPSALNNAVNYLDAIAYFIQVVKLQTLAALLIMYLPADSISKRPLASAIFH